MKKICFIAVAIALIMLTAISCNSRKSGLDHLRSFSAELTEKSANYEQKDWEKAVKEYAVIEKELSDGEYTDKEPKEIGKLKARCYAEMTKGAMNSAKGLIHDYGKQIQGAIEGLQNSQDEIMSEMESVSKELMDAFGDMNIESETSTEE